MPATPVLAGPADNGGADWPPLHCEVLRIDPTEQPKPPKKRRWRRLGAWLLGLLVVGIGCAWGVTTCTRGEATSVPPVLLTGAGQVTAAVGPIRVMTVNLAHGRGTSFHQLFVGKESIAANLAKVAAVVREAGAELVALQEADGPSSWSGSFDHVGFVAREAGLAAAVRGAHVSGLGLSYGTAVLAGYKIEDSVSITFAPSPPTFAKGFVEATIEVPAPGGGTRAVRFVSVHLDFAGDATRRSQFAEMIAHMKDRSGPLIVCGDFNCGWTDADSPLKAFAAALALSAHEPEAGEPTFPTLGRRIDWILVSPEFEFASYRVLHDAALSDHHPVVAELRWRR